MSSNNIFFRTVLIMISFKQELKYIFVN